MSKFFSGFNPLSWFSKSAKTEKDDTKDSPPEIDNQKNSGEYSELDLVFCMDCTSSMSCYIQQGKESIINITERVKASEKVDVRFKYIAYRDHKPQDYTFVTRSHGFTKSPKEMRSYISKYDASGGGDGPEAVTPALNEALKSDFRKNAAKIVVLIADAPPHGVQSADGFPDGDPSGLDPIEIAKEMSKAGIVLYVVACEPSLSNYQNAHDVMAGLAKITEGKYLPLTGAHLLPDVIVGGAEEEISLKKLESFVESEMKKMKKENPQMSVDELNVALEGKLKSRNIKQRQVLVDDIYGGYNCDNIDFVYEKCSHLSEARGGMKKLAQPQMHSHHGKSKRMRSASSRMNDSDLFESADIISPQKCHISSVNMEKHHVSRMMNRVNNQSSEKYF